MNKVIVLLSGGVDSVTALYKSFKENEILAGLSFDYGSKHNKKELQMAKYHCSNLNLKHQIIKLDFIKELFISHLLSSGGEIPEGHYQDSSMKQTVVPFRNGIMLSIAAGYAESINAQGVLIAAHTGDHAIYPDCRNDFMESMGSSLSKGTYANIKLLRPFIGLDKSQIISIGEKLNIDYRKTWSCYKGEKIHCGKCGTCIERREAFIKAGVFDPTEYESVEPLPSKKNDQ